MRRLSTLLLLILLLTACQEKTDPNKREIGQMSDKETVAKQTDNSQEIAWATIDNDEALIATALMAAPKESREGCKVIGYNMAGEFVTLREGNNEFIVLADDPNRDGFSAAAYHKDLEPFMARGRELKAEGKSRQEIFDIREEEIRSGKLQMGPPGSTLHIYFGPNAQYDPETFNVDGAIYRYVVYIPFATSETTGLPEEPISNNHPWIMDPGTHKAHIMISPIPEMP
jgi:hypothetical protein